MRGLEGEGFCCRCPWTECQKLGCKSGARRKEWSGRSVGGEACHPENAARSVWGAELLAQPALETLTQTAEPSWRALAFCPSLVGGLQAGRGVGLGCSQRRFGLVGSGRKRVRGSVSQG